MEVIMATATKEKTSAEQIGNHTVSSAVQHESICSRCGGLMVQDFCLDVLSNIGESEFAAKRCVQCGEVVDPVILRNRETQQEPMTVRSSMACSDAL
jgi:Pyruvate/2-oxoacid:ferredoxin oxidoreductase delta subunit